MKGLTVNSKSGANYAPKKFASHPLAEGVTKNAFTATMERLMKKNEIQDYNTARATAIERVRKEKLPDKGNNFFNS